MRRLGVLFALLAVLAIAVPAVSQYASLTTNSISQANTSLPITIDGGSTYGVKIGSAGSPFRSLRSFSMVRTGSQQAANTCAPQSFTVTGVAANDVIVGFNYPATGNALGYGFARVSATNTVTQIICNPSSGVLTPADGTFTYWVIR